MAAATVIVAQTVVLRRLAVHLRSHQHAQQASVVGRYGGEEFLLILRVPDPSSAHDACERLSRRLANEPLHGLNVTVSVGLVVTAVFSSIEGPTARPSIPLPTAAEDGYSLRSFQVC